jgi:hypothetical protein
MLAGVVFVEGVVLEWEQNERDRIALVAELERLRKQGVALAVEAEASKATTKAEQTKAKTIAADAQAKARAIIDAAEAEAVGIVEAAQARVAKDKALVKDYSDEVALQKSNLATVRAEVEELEAARERLRAEMARLLG